MFKCELNELVMGQLEDSGERQKQEQSEISKRQDGM